MCALLAALNSTKENLSRSIGERGGTKDTCDYTLHNYIKTVLNGQISTTPEHIGGLNLPRQRVKITDLE